MTRAEAARLAGMERMALRDAVVRYNAEGLLGLYDRPKGRPPERLSAGEQAALVSLILRGPDPERDGVSAWTLPALCRMIEERFNKRLHPASLSRIVRRLGLSRQKARPVHPRSDAKAKAAFQRRGSSPA